MNIKLLKRIKRAILARPDQFEMAWWFSDLTEVNRFRKIRQQKELKKISHCGTAACIAGWAIALESRKPHTKTNLTETRASFPTFLSPVNTKAALLLNLPDNGNRLFGLWFWPNNFQERYQVAVTVKEQAQVAADRIDHFIKTNGAE